MVAIPKPKDSGGFPCFNPTEKRMRLCSGSKRARVAQRPRSIALPLPIPYSLFPIPCSLLPIP